MKILRIQCSLFTEINWISPTINECLFAFHRSLKWILELFCEFIYYCILKSILLQIFILIYQNWFTICYLARLGYDPSCLFARQDESFAWFTYKSPAELYICMHLVLLFSATYFCYFLFHILSKSSLLSKNMQKITKNPNM